MVMDAMTYSAFRANLAKTLDSVCDNHLGVIITRRNGKTVVVLSLEDYRGMEETNYLLSTQNNTKEIHEALKEYESGEFEDMELIKDYED